MALRMTPQEVEAMRQKGLKVSGRAAGPALSLGAHQVAMGIAGTEGLTARAPRMPWRPQHKYSAQRTVLDGRNFGSKAEAQYHAHLRREEVAGRLAWFLWQVPFHMPGTPTAIRYVLDFMEFWMDGSIEFTDVKGFMTKEFIMKRRMVEALYPVKIRTVKILKTGPHYQVNQ